MSLYTQAEACLHWSEDPDPVCSLWFDDVVEMLSARNVILDNIAGQTSDELVSTLFRAMLMGWHMRELHMIERYRGKPSRVKDGSL